MKSTLDSAPTSEKARVKAPSRPWLPLALLATGGLLMALAVTLALGARGGRPRPLAVGAPLGDFSLTAVDGRTVRLRDYRGQVVLVNAWGTWCPPCRAKMPALNDFYRRHAAKGFVILAVNAGDPTAEVIAFTRSYGLEFPVLLDPESRWADQMNIHSFPTSIIIGRDGLVKEIHVGMLFPEQIEEKIGPLLE